MASGAPKAIIATAHKLARILYTVMRYGAEEFVDEHRKRQEQNRHRRAKELGYELKKIEAPKDEVAASESSK